MDQEESPAVIVSEEGATMMDIRAVRVDEGRLVIRGALMGAWEADMFMDAESVRKLVGVLPLGQIINFAVKDVLGVKITRAE